MFSFNKCSYLGAQFSYKNMDSFPKLMFGLVMKVVNLLLLLALLLLLLRLLALLVLLLLLQTL